MATPSRIRIIPKVCEQLSEEVIERHIISRFFDSLVGQVEEISPQIDEIFRVCPTFYTWRF